MKAATRSLVGLLAMAGVGGGIAAWAYVRSGEAPTSAGGAKNPQLFRHDPLEVNAFELNAQGNVTRVVLTREGWRVTKPRSLAANDQDVGSLFTALGNMKVNAEFGTSERPEVPNPALTGLTQPEASLTVFFGAIGEADKAGENARRWKLERGAASEFNREHYIRVTDVDGTERMGTLSPSLAGNLDRSAGSFRDKRALAANSNRLVSLRVEPQPVTEESIVYEVKRLPPDPEIPEYKQKRRFKTVEPAVGLADTQLVTKAITGLGRAPLSNIIEPDHKGALAPFGLEPPAYKVTVELLPFRPDDKGPIKRVVRISAPSDDQKVRVTIDGETWVAEASEKLVEDLGLSLGELKSKELFAFDRDAVARLELDLAEAGRIVVERNPENNDWLMLAPEPAKASAHHVNSLIMAFAELHGEAREAEGAQVADAAVLSRTGLAKPQKIKFVDKKSKTLGTLHLGARQNQDAFAMAEGGTYIVRIPASRLDVLPLNSAQLVATH